MDTNYANAGGGVVSGSSVGGGGGGGGGGVSAAAIAVGVNSSSRYNAGYYKDPLISCQGSITYNSYDPYGGSAAGVRASSVYPYDAEAEFKERTGMGKVKTSQQLAGNTVNNSVKIQQHHSYNANSCYGSYNQNSAALTPESGNYYAYPYDQHHHYPQQQQQYHQNQLQQQQQQQYKYNVNAKVVSQQQLHLHQQQQHHHPHQHQQQQHNLNSGTVNGIKITPPDYGGYAPYHHHLQHPYYYPHYHHQASQKGGVGLVKTMPDASAMPYVNSKMLHSAAVGGARVPQYPSNYSYHPHGYPSTVSAGHHTYQSQGVCDDSRWIWNSGSSSSEYQNSCRNAYPAYVNGSAAKQTTMWPSMPMQYQNQMSSGYPATAANQSCCSSTQNTANYYQQQYVKYPMQSLPNAMDYNGSTNDLYSNSQVNSALSPATASPKVYTDLNAQSQSNSCQMMNSSSVSCRRDYNTSASLDYNGRYLQQQQTDSPSSSSASSTSSYNNLYYHNLHPYAHQSFATAEPQENIYSQQQVDTKIGLTTKSQNLRDFLSTWNEDEDECSDRTDVSFIEQLHLPSDHFGQSQDQQLNGISNQKVENHLQFKGSFTSRPKIHVGITVDSTVESDQYINLPDIIIDIEKSSKDVLNLPEDILVANIPKIEKEESTLIKEEMPDTEVTSPSTTPTTISTSTIKTKNLLPQNEKDQKKERKKLPCYKRISRLQKLRLIHQRRSKIVPRKLLHPKIRRIKNKSFTQARLNPQSLKCLCVSFINSDKFRNRILGPSEIDSFIQLTTDNEVNIVDTVSALPTVSAVSAGAVTELNTTNPSSSSVIPKLSDLCKNALNSSFDRDVLVINLDEILDSDNLFVVQCDINENILENYVDQQLQIQEQQDPTHQQQIQLQLQLQQQQQQQQRQQNEQQQHDNVADLVEILNDNNNNYNSEISGSNYVVASVSSQATQTKPINTNISNGSSIRNSSSSSKDMVTAIPTNRIREKLKRCCSVAEVSNLPLDNAVEHNDLNSVTTNPLVHLDSLSLSLSPPSPCSSSCPAALHYDTSSVLIEQNCPIQQITNEHEQLHEMLMLSEIVHVVSDDDDNVDHDVVDFNLEDDQRSCSQHDHHDPHYHHHDHQQHLLENDNTNISESNNSELLLMASSVATPTIHHEEIVPDNMKKFQNEKFLKYLHAKYVQGNLSKFYHANRIIKKYKKRIIKKILNIVR